MEGSQFDVFLTFRGEDTRKGFTDHLHEGLKQRGISTFIDSENLEKGEKIGELLACIEKSKICIPIFSKGYADSRWCLRELAKIVECNKKVIPVFLDVDPSDVKKQSGPFASAFEKHQSEGQLKSEEVRKWRDALTEVGNISGFTLKDTDGHEAKLKLKIIEKVLSKLNWKPFVVAKHPIGIETRVQEVKKMLENGDDDVHIVGIHGMGGLGKTTIAKAVYNDLIDRFSDLIDGFSSAHCFISDIREKSGEPNGLVTLQKQLFRDIFKCENMSLRDVQHGINLIKERAKRKSVLLVLDDVDSMDQVDALAGESDWFGSGSVIIITTRDEKVLRACNVKQQKIYKPEQLNEAQSLELFAQHAFKGKQPQGEYLQLSSEVVAAAGGLPLTLEVLGSLLTCDMDVQKWKDTLKKLQTIPLTEVQQSLKLSYDSLEELEQQIFLDISCFFIGWGRENAIYMWDDSGWFPHLAIGVLVQKSLIKIDEKSGQFQMHDQIRDMGRAIVLGGSPRKPQKQSRVWIYQDSLDLLQRKVPGTLDAEGMEIKPNDKKLYGKCVSAQCFERMCNLRYLYVQHVNFRGTYSCFPTDLKWVFLDNCHFDSPPSDSDFNLENVVILNLHKTNMAQILTNQLKVAAFEKLKVLSFSKVEIKMTPNFKCLPCLVNLTLHECRALTMIDESIGELKSSLKVLHLMSCSTLSSLPNRLGDLKSLVELKIQYVSIKTIPESISGLTNLCKLSVTQCEQLNLLPDSVCLLSSLECLNLAHCSRLASLPERLGDLASLTELRLNLTGIEVPCSVGLLINLRKLSARFCKRVSRLPDSICQLSCLEVLDLGLCQKLSCVPERLGDMQSLETLDLSYSCIRTIPNSIGQLTNLRRLSLQQSDCLRELPGSICRLGLLEAIYLQWCSNFSSLPERLGDIEKLKILILDQTRVQTIPNSVGRLKNLRVLSLEGCKLLKEVPDSIRQLSSLQQLNVSGTTLEGFEKHISRLAAINALTGSSVELLGLSDQSRKAIKHLRLVDATIEELPDCVGGLESLEELMLECEMLRALPNSMEQHFRKLTKLEIKSDHLEALPDCIGLLKRLQGLRLECENLKALPSSIGSLKDMRSLELYCMNLEALPDSIGRLGNIDRFFIKSQNLKTLPNWIESLGRVQDLTLHCKILEAIPDSIIGLKELDKLKVRSGCLKVLPNSIGSLKKVRELILNCPNLEKLADSIGELASLSSLEVYSDGLKYLPNSIGFLTRIGRLMLKCENLEALPDSMETLKSLTELKLHCNNFSVPPDFIGRLENLVSFSFQSKNLEHLRVAIGSFARLEDLSLTGCRNLKALAATSIQETGLAHLPSLQSLHLQDCSSLEYLPQLPSSLCLLDASRCTNLRKVSDVSGLKILKALRLGGCKWIEDVPGLENIAIHLEELVLPGPCNFKGCCHLSHDFKNKAFKEMAFENLRSFGMSGFLLKGTATGQQQLHFMLPRLPFRRLVGARLNLRLLEVLSPVYTTIMADGFSVFVKQTGGGSEVEFNLREESISNIGDGEEEHCYTLLVMTDVSELYDASVSLYTDNTVGERRLRSENQRFFRISYCPTILHDRFDAPPNGILRSIDLW